MDAKGRKVVKSQQGNEYFNFFSGTSLVVQWLGLPAFTAEGDGSIPEKQDLASSWAKKNNNSFL